MIEATNSQVDSGSNSTLFSYLADLKEAFNSDNPTNAVHWREKRNNIVATQYISHCCRELEFRVSVVFYSWKSLSSQLQCCTTEWKQHVVQKQYKDVCQQSLVEIQQSETPQTRNDPESETSDELDHSLFDPTTVYMTTAQK